MDLGLTGRRALVCGASSGLGLAIAEALLAEGASVAANGRDRKRLDGAWTRGRVDAIVGDVTTDAERIVREAGDVDILIANAGGPPAGRFDQHDPSVWYKAIELNLLSTMRLVHAALPGMRQRKWGRIVCLTSIAALQAEPHLILSTTARAGVHGFAKALSDEVAAEGVTVNCVAPGFIATDRLKELFSDEKRASLAGQIPMRRIGEPAELAAAVAFLVSEPARYITGTVVRVDGGFVRSLH
ncbi:MAG: SDR family oxidoreductase [Gemmatimonadales bacterium]